jgi:acyl-CoA dehydrogenase
MERALAAVSTPGVRIVRDVATMEQPAEHFGRIGGHAEIVYEGVRVPKDALLGARGAGFLIAQQRLGPGRIHHCMRLIGAAERALALMSRRAGERETFGRRLVERQLVQDWIARSRIDIEQARLLVLKAAWMMDEVGNKEARQEIAMIKIVAPNVASQVVDRAIQTFGGAGVSQDTPLAGLFAYARTLRLADGPDEVHLVSVARQELRRQLP